MDTTEMLWYGYTLQPGYVELTRSLSRKDRQGPHHGRVDIRGYLEAMV